MPDEHIHLCNSCVHAAGRCEAQVLAVDVTRAEDGVRWIIGCPRHTKGLSSRRAQEAMAELARGQKPCPLEIQKVIAGSFLDLV